MLFIFLVCGIIVIVLGEGGGIVYFFLGDPRLMKTWCWSEAICGFWFLLGRVMVVFLYLCFNKKDNYK